MSIGRYRVSGELGPVSHYCHVVKAGGKPDQIVKVQIFMTDISERSSINPIRIEYFDDHKPASTLVEVSALVDSRMKVEIEAVAYIGQ